MKVAKGGDVRAGTRLLQRFHVLAAALDRNNRPDRAGGNKHQIHEEPRQPAIAVHVGVDVDEEEMSQDRAHGVPNRALNHATIFGTTTRFDADQGRAQFYGERFDIAQYCDIAQ